MSTNTEDIIEALDMALQGLLTARVALCPSLGPELPAEALEQALRVSDTYQAAMDKIAEMIGLLDDELGPSGFELLCELESAVHLLANEVGETAWKLGLTVSRTPR